jgi:hypothetical protein
LETLLTGLANMGGLGILAAALLYLHVTSLKSFREELAEERSGFMARNSRLVDAINEQTKELASQFHDLKTELIEMERRYYDRSK